MNCREASNHTESSACLFVTAAAAVAAEAEEEKGWSGDLETWMLSRQPQLPLHLPPSLAVSQQSPGRQAEPAAAQPSAVPLSHAATFGGPQMLIWRQLSLPFLGKPPLPGSGPCAAPDPYHDRP